MLWKPFVESEERRPRRGVQQECSPGAQRVWFSRGSRDRRMPWDEVHVCELFAESWAGTDAVWFAQPSAERRNSIISINQADITLLPQHTSRW